MAELTMGVEEEFLLVDPETGAPAAANRAVAETAAAAGVELQLELTRCQVETSSDVHTDAAALDRQLHELRRAVAHCAERNRVRLLATAAPPTVPHEFPLTDTPRYRAIGDAFGMIAHEQGLSGCHVHVAVPDQEIAVRVSNHLRPWLPALLALSANSAIYRGSDTGYASWRSILWRRWPSAGPPPYFRSVRDYEAVVDTMLACGSILDRKMVYWDVRPSLTFPTVEVRVGDVPATARESTLLALLVRGLVLHARKALARREEAPDIPHEILLAAYWTAARSGLDGETLEPVSGRVLPVPALLDELVRRIGPELDELGDRAFVTDAMAEVLSRGNGARRQRRAYATRHDAADVITELAGATLEGYEFSPAHLG
ncbi:carboxylate-amine ligase [Nocardia jiangsuensis]|uniref:Putative glutamate--cysteine ligase 2 n=1 Tax=Nocardia jiangsuensis TaxID=1691563 RepID=A0ABV8DXY6_9NOCA